MCGTCGCRDAESYEAPFFEMDDVCVSCGADEVAYESNICEGCQIRFGIEKLGAEYIEFNKSDFEEIEDSLEKDINSLKQTHNMMNDFKGAESFEAKAYSYYHRRKAYDAWRKNYEESGILESSEKWNALYNSYEKFKSQGFSEFESMIKAMKEKRIYNQLMKGVNVDALSGYYGYEEVLEGRAESFEAQRKITDVDRDGKPYTGQIYPDHPNLDPVKADRNNDGYMSSWERALGNQVAMGMERGGYSAEGAGSRFPWKTLIAVAVGVFAVSRIKNVEFKAEGGCGCGCSGGGGCGDKKSAEGYPEVYDPVADFLPRYRYPADSVWSNDYNPADPYRPLDYQTVHTDSNTKAKRM